MTRADLEILNDEIGQWSDTSRERFAAAYARTGKARGRKRRQVIPACSADDPEDFAKKKLCEKGDGDP